MTIDKKINGYQHDYTLRAKVCMRNGQSESGHVP